jgi:hypothetical protein
MEVSSREDGEPFARNINLPTDLRAPAKGLHLLGDRRARLPHDPAVGRAV